MLKSTLTGLYILLVAVIAVCIFYNYPSMLHLLPQGSHLWRQADCMAMTQNYQQFNLPFLQPEIYNLQSVNGKVVGEFPVFYFMAAQFKNAAFALRLIHSVIFLAGILSTYFIAFYFLQRRFLSFVCSLLLFTSPLLVFYGNNFLSDVPALSFAFIGWSFFLYSNKKENMLMFLLAFILFAFAALLKASEIISFVIAFIFLLKIKPFKIKLFIPFTFCILPLCWYFYAKNYNKTNHDTYYFLNVFPIWKVALHDIGLGIWRMTISLSKNYFWRPTSVFLIMSSYFLIRHWKKLDIELRILIGTSFLLAIIYLLLFYQKMIGHEYYYVPFYIFVLFGIIGLLKTYNLFHAENVFTHTLLFLCLIPNLIFCKIFVTEKLTDNLYNGYLSSDEMQDFLEKNGVTENKILISLPDDSPDKTLYQLKRKGYTEFNDYLSVLKDKKADYLLLSNNGFMYTKELKPYQIIGNFNGITLYKLK